MKFSEIISNPRINFKWNKVRKFFSLKESTFDMTSRCNLSCDGCYYFQGEKQYKENNSSPSAWRNLFEEEKRRGINFVVLAGAEPSLVPSLLRQGHEVIPLGCVATNGLRKIPEDIGYKIHISVWGNDQTSQDVRGAKCLDLQLKNYAQDPRSVFVYTFTRSNVRESRAVLHDILGSGAKVTFNQFSSPVGYQGSLQLDETSRADMRGIMRHFLECYPEQVLYSHYNIEVHANELSLHDQFGCPYPRMNSGALVGIGKSFRQYRADLSWDQDAACCVPDTDCRDCRHYASGSAIVTSKLLRHTDNVEIFSKWLDYVDNYLAVWVSGYEKERELLYHPLPTGEMIHEAH